MIVSKLKDSKGYTLSHNVNSYTLPLIDRLPEKEKSLCMNVTHYLPSGGAEISLQPVEAIFYVMTGEMTILTENGDIILREGEAIYFSPGESKGLRNHTNYPATMLVAAVLGEPPKEE